MLCGSEAAWSCNTRGRAISAQSRRLRGVRKGPVERISVGSGDANGRGRRNPAVSLEIGEQRIRIVAADLRLGSALERGKTIAAECEIVVHGDAVGSCRLDRHAAQ